MIEQEPIEVVGDPRIGKMASYHDFIGEIESILRFPDGFEYIHLHNGVTGIGGIDASKITMIEVKNDEV